MDERGWRELDVLLISGDAYFDHPSHGAAVIGRVLEHAGYRVGMIARPNWGSLEDFKKLGRPTLFAGVTAGAVDSIVNNYTAHMAKRKDDTYAPGGVGGGRPDLSTLVYANRVREAYPGLKVVLGGIEASLRRFAYYDAQKDKIRRSILLDARADLLVFGPGEKQAVQVANRLAEGNTLDGIPGTARLIRGSSGGRISAQVVLPEFEAIAADSKRLLEQTIALEISARPSFGGRVMQCYREGVVLCEPAAKSTTEELDDIADLPFVRDQHPVYTEAIPALETVRWSQISHRGCPGGCSFCGLAIHQGRGVVARSVESLVDEARRLVRSPGFKGTITDVGGPTANAFPVVRTKISACKSCKRVSCLFPKICRHLDTRQGSLLHLLDKIRSQKGIKRVYLASGLRHDLALKDPQFIEQVAKHHTGGHLKAAPEHVAREVLTLMRKPPIELFEEFERVFLQASKKQGKKQYIVPYFIAGFPGCTESRADAIGKWLSGRGQTLRQSQSFIPLAGTTAAAMFICRKDEKGNTIYIPNLKERKRQKQLLTAQKKGRPRR